MGHNLNFNDKTGRYSFFSVKEKAWHNLGQLVSDYPTSSEAIQRAGLDYEVGTKITQQAIKNISGKTISTINQKVNFRLLTKFGSKGAINFGKAVPLIGGIIGGTFDLAATNIIGNVARNTFIND